MTRIVMLLLLLPLTAAAQMVQISGTVVDAATKKPLQYATVRVEGAARGTTSDAAGRYVLPLPAGRCTLVASYLGYRSEKREIEVGADAMDVPFRLVMGRIDMKPVTVTPADNPALPIIRAAIEAKRKRQETLENYHLASHSKMTISVGVKGGTMGADKDTSGMAVMETQTDAWWARPDRYKEVITARRQTASVGAQANVLPSSFFLIDFSADYLPISAGAPIVGPISKAGLARYDYTLAGTTELDGTIVHIIRIAALDDDDPLLDGTLYIASDSYMLAMVDVGLNKAALSTASIVAARAGGVRVPLTFADIAYKQHFRLFETRFWMPVDVVVHARCTVSLVKVVLDVSGFSVLQDYTFNQPLADDFFERTQIRVLKEADLRDSSYWAAHQKIPNTMQELAAYRSADSVVALSPPPDPAKVHLTSSFDIYHFNRVHGHQLRAPLEITIPATPVERIDALAAYGFANRRIDYDLAVSAHVPRTTGIGFTARMFDRTASVDEDFPRLNSFGTTVSSLFFKYDDKDYFHAKGVQGALTFDAFRLFPTRVAVTRSAELSAWKRTDWSLTRGHWQYRDNPSINDGMFTDVDVSTTFDDRPFMDDAGVVTRIGGLAYVPRLAYGWHTASIAGAQHTWHTVDFSLGCSLDWGLAGASSYLLAGRYASGALPVQRLFSVPGSIRGVAQSWRFRTLDAREFGGDRLAALMVEHDFRGELYRFLGIPFLKSSGWGLVLFGGAAWAGMTDATRALQRVPVQPSAVPVYEAGFGISELPLGLRLDLAWRLNHFRAGRNFFIGVTLPFLQ